MGRHPVANTLSCCSLIFLYENVLVLYYTNMTLYIYICKSLYWDVEKKITDLIDGGAPAGMRIRDGEDGWRRKRSTIRTITRHGNNKTKPKGTEIEEFRFSRIRRRKNANLGNTGPFSLGNSSSDGIAAVDGRRFLIRCINPIGTERGHYAALDTID
jgi:hypothetical protein